MKHGSLFSGIGGFDLAAEWMGWENIFHCEWNEFGQKVLKHYWPKAISYEDITKTDFTIHRGQIDILTGGFPCQPYSQAGKRLGKEDDRHLWPEMLRAIREIAPSYVVGENVRGLVNWSEGLVFEEVCADLEAEGYEVQPMLLPACAVNAPHRRDRIWFIAFKDTNKNGWRGFKWQKKPDKWEQRNFSTGNNELLQANNVKIRVTPYTDSNGQHRGNGKNEINASERGFDAQRDIEPICEYEPTPSSDSELSERRSGENRPEEAKRHISTPFCRNTWENFPTKSPICDGDDGFSERLDGITFPKWRNESIKAGGNAIVPQVAYQIFKAIEEIEKNKI